MIDFAWRLAALVVAGLVAVFVIGLLVGVGVERAQDLFTNPPVPSEGVGNGDR